jgi:hypothetical protein
MRKIAGLLFLCVFLTACSADAAPAQTGTLSGRVTIGPINPVEREGENPTPPPEVYAARQIVVFNRTGKREVARVDIDSNGTYEVSLPPGEYVVDINHAGIDSAAGLPQTVTIRADQATQLDIDIDTGIR